MSCDMAIAPGAAPDAAFSERVKSYFLTTAWRYRAGPGAETPEHASKGRVPGAEMW